ncbi:hypothetical protein GQF42_35240 [Streptomyces broussonetiae]|uniref:Uncharacterized protein n=1 Tax=Streptomyces broussonetiae TaxID=2686304 RepID=A0A6I6N905_9ACTN|nr:hypothetical protein GQF42_35240 [Streptomyces broussonetiae]
MKAQVAGRAVLLVPHRGDAADEAAHPADYHQINQRLRTRCVTTRRARGHFRTAQLCRPENR